MAKQTSSSRAEVEARITDSIIAAMETEGTLAWRKPWSGVGVAPRSVATGKPYRGINWLLLSVEQQERGYEQPLWLTLKQANAMGGRIVKGQRSTEVVFWKVVEREVVEDGETVKVGTPLLRTYRVFNIAQTEGVTLPPRFAPQPKGEPVEVLDGVQRCLDAYVDGPTVKHVKGDRAFYRPSEDSITLPLREQFETAEGYAETVLHELVHSTGHASRLDRHEGGSCFGSASYAAEELVAEIGMAMLAEHVGIRIDVKQPAAYVQGWLRALKDDRSMIIKAAQQAQKAADRILPAEAVAVVEQEEPALAA